jgi:hypothetical protein
MAVVGKVEAAIDPYALLRNFDIFLRVHGPLSLGGNPLSSCALSALHREWGSGVGSVNSSKQ